MSRRVDGSDRPSDLCGQVLDACMTHSSVGGESAFEHGTKSGRQFWRDFADGSPLPRKDRGQHRVPVLVVERPSRREREDSRRGPVDIGP